MIVKTDALVYEMLRSTYVEKLENHRKRANEYCEKGKYGKVFLELCKCWKLYSNQKKVYKWYGKTLK